MIHLNEGGNSGLKNRTWRIPKNVLNHLIQVLNDNSKKDFDGNATTKEAFDHLLFILDIKNEDYDDTKKYSDKELSGININYREMNRIKGWYEKNGCDTPQFVLYGGNTMKDWVNNALNSAIKIEKDNKKFKDSVAITKKEVSIKPKVPSHNPVKDAVDKNYQDLKNLEECKIIIISENQEKILTRL